MPRGVQYVGSVRLSDNQYRDFEGKRFDKKQRAAQQKQLTNYLDAVSATNYEGTNPRWGEGMERMRSADAALYAARAVLGEATRHRYKSEARGEKREDAGWDEGVAPLSDFSLSTGSTPTNQYECDENLGGGGLLGGGFYFAGYKNFSAFGSHISYRALDA